MIPHGSGWTSFLYELNKICADLCAANAQIEALKQALEKQNLHILGHIKKRQDLEAQLSALQREYLDARYERDRYRAALEEYLGTEMSAIAKRALKIEP